MTGTSSPPPQGAGPLPVDVAERYLSVARMRTYRVAAGGDAQALALYEWNTRAAGALWPVLGDVDVAVRNAIDTQLQNRHVQLGRRGHWLTDPARELDEHARADVTKAMDRLGRGRISTPPPGKVLAELSFGFWRFLLARRYTATLWPVISPGFAYMPSRDRLFLEKPMRDLHQLRNRTAHQEPLFAQPLADRHEQALTVLGYLDPSPRAWAQAHSQLPAVLADLPPGITGPYAAPR